MLTKAQVSKQLKILANAEFAIGYQRFFKTSKGEYAQGDKFLGIRVPELRKLAKKADGLDFTELSKLISSKWHEERMLGLIILVNKYKKSKTEAEHEHIYQHYLKHFEYINNWDLVDVTCPHIVGAHLFTRDRKILYRWAKSDNLWVKRIAIISTMYFIKQGELDDSYKLSQLLLKDEHDLMHKAIGWTLRECGKRDENRLKVFLKEHIRELPRTSLRYAIEKFSEKTRKQFLSL